MMNRLRYIFLFASVLLFCLGISSQSVSLSLSLPRGQRNIAVGDIFYITYEISDIEASASKPAGAPGAKVMYFDRTGQSSRFTSYNGQSRQSFSYIYTLTLKAEIEGKYTFGPISVGGYKSNSVSYTIGKTGNNQPQTSPASSSNQNFHDPADGPKFIGKGDGNLFLRADVSKTTAYEQEAIVYTVKLYSSYERIKFIGATQAPKFDGFVVEESKDVSSSLKYETYNGKTYATAIIARYIIFPQMRGNLKVVGNTYTISVDQREYYRDPFWGSLSLSSPLQLNVTPNDLSINVIPLPSPQPVDFCGGVGQFSISSQMPTTKLSTNQVASIIYTIKGNGNLKYIKLPDLQSFYPSEIEVNTPTSDIDASVGASNVSGTAKFDYSLVPLEEGAFVIPAISMSYFDPVSKQYKKISAKGYSVIVGKGDSSSKSQTTEKIRFNSKLLPVSPSSLKKNHLSLVSLFSFWLIFVIPVIILIIISIIYRKHLKNLADIEGLKSRRAGRIARSRLKKAYKCIVKNDSNHFYDEILSALWGYLAHKLKMPTSELTRDNIASKLSQNDVDNTLIEKYISLLDDIEYDRYSPGLANKDMNKIYSEAIDVIETSEKSLRKVKDVDSDESELVDISHKLDKELNDKN